jgi:hypothetical protein
MKTMRALYHLARADFLERVQRYSFVFTLLATVYLGLAVVGGDIHLHLGQFRGEFNSAWVGLLMAITASTVVSLAGFYLVKNAVDRDRQTGVGQLLACAPISRLTYLLGKWLSNLAVLGSILIVLAFAAVLAQLTAGEASQLDLWALLSPFLFIALPALACVAGLAVFFEVVPWLRGGFGNLVYFALWIFLLSWGLERHNSYADFTGMEWVAHQVGDHLRQSHPGFKSGIGLSMGDGDAGLLTFVWPGFRWISTGGWLRCYWLAVAFALVLMGALWFDRFDLSRRPIWGLVKHFVGNRTPVDQRTAPVVVAPLSTQAIGYQSTCPARSGVLPGCGSASLITPRFRFGGVLLAELRLMLKGQSWWWYAGAVVFLIASLTHPLKDGREDLLPFVWLWPVLLWSPMGTRETRHRTSQLLFNAPHAVSRQLPATWLAGVLLALATGAGVGVKLAMAQDWGGLLGWTVGAVFIPSAALAMGVWSGSSKLFEALFILCWYIGPIQKVGPFNFMTTSPTAITAGLPGIYLLATLVLLAVAVIGRRRQAFSNRL